MHWFARTEWTGAQEARNMQQGQLCWQTKDQLYLRSSLRKGHWDTQRLIRMKKTPLLLVPLQVFAASQTRISSFHRPGWLQPVVSWIRRY